MLGCITLSACQAGNDPAGCKLIHVTDLPVTVLDDAFYTTIKINGQDVQVQFDTGSADNIISEAAARRLNMNVFVSGERYIVGIGGEARTGEARSRNVSLGDAKGEDLKFTTLPDSPSRPGVDGVLGMNFLTGFDLDLDFWSRKIGLYKTLGQCDAPYTALKPPFYSADLVDPDENRDSLRDYNELVDISPNLIISINGVALRAKVDTGAFHTSIFRDSARRAGVMTGDSIATINVSGFGPHGIKGDVRLIPALVIGPLTVKNVPVVVTDQRHVQGTDMLLGYDFVTRVHLWISKSSKTLIMQYPPQPTPAAQ